LILLDFLLESYLVQPRMLQGAGSSMITQFYGAFTLATTSGLCLPSSS
jgi:hypothetical protein